MAFPIKAEVRGANFLSFFETYIILIACTIEFSWDLFLIRYYRNRGGQFETVGQGDFPVFCLKHIFMARAQKASNIGSFIIGHMAEASK